MENITVGILNTVDAFFSKHSQLDDGITAINLSADKWSLKQIVGHLIDSAANNHQRFVRMQFADTLQLSDYNKDEWLSVSNYNDFSFYDLMQLLVYYNKLIVHLIKNTKEDALGNKWIVEWDTDKREITLKELIPHYLEHLTGHVEHFENRLDEIRSSRAVD